MPTPCICKQCGKSFTARPSIVKNGGGKFCSRSCLGKWRSENMSGDNNPIKNIKWSEERKIKFKSQFKMPPSRKGVIVSQEAKLKMSLSRLGKVPWNKNKILPPLSDNHKQKISVGLIKDYASNPESLKRRSGINSGHYIHGDAIKKYCYKFDGVNGVRNRSLAFFNYKCIECEKTNDQNKKETGMSLNVHHVYYRKMSCCETELEYESGIRKIGNKLYINEYNGKIVKHDIIGKPEKFAVLCHSCHGKTTSRNRLFWIQYYENKINKLYNGKSFLTKEEYNKL